MFNIPYTYIKKILSSVLILVVVITLSLGSILLGTPSTSRIAQAATPNVKIGLVADVHNNPVDYYGGPGYDRRRSQAPALLQNFIDEMNNNFQPDFIIELGDFIDNADRTKEENLSDLQQIDNIYKQSNMPRYYVLGNHELTLLTKSEFQSTVGIDYKYTSFNVGEYHFVILDAEYDPADESDRGAESFTAGHISPAELTWLANDLASATKPVIVFTHQLLDDQVNASSMYAVDNKAEVRQVLENSSKVIAVFQGHIHSDNYSTIKGGIAYFSFESLIDNPPVGAYAKITLNPTTDIIDVEVAGTGNSWTHLDGLGNTPWPMYNHNVKHTGVSAYSGVPYPAVKWKYDLGGDPGIAHSAIASDGTIYFPGSDGNLYAINPDGTAKWTFAAGGGINTSPAIDGLGVIHIGSGSKVYAINSDGTEKWSYTAGGTIRPGGAIAIDGTTYFGSYDDNLYAFNPDGTVKWTYTTGGDVRTVPAIADDGTIYFRSLDRYLYALNPDGTLKWRTQLGAAGEPSRSSPAVGSDGTIYVLSINPATSAHALYALNPSDGSQKWVTADFPNSAGTYYPSPSINGNVIIQPYIAAPGVGSRAVIAFNTSDGSQSWVKYVDPDKVGGDGNIAIDTNGIMYEAGLTGINAMNSDGTLKWKYHTSSTNYGYATLGDGVLYAGMNATDDAIAFQPWTLSAAVNPSGYYQVSDTITFTATTSMLATDPITSEANQVQIYDATGGTVLTTLTYSSTDGDGNTVWTGTWDVPEGTTDGTYTATIEAAAVNVETDTTVHFASAPTNSNNTGITTTVNYVVDTTAPTGTTLSFGTIASNSIIVNASSTDATAGLHSSAPYYFQETSTSSNTGWQAETSWTNGSLSENTEYSYQLKARDKALNESALTTAQSKYTLIQTPTAISFDDVGVNSLTISATGTLSNLTSGSSGIYFDETSENSGGADSTWTQTNSYQNTGLSENTQYTYKVKARNGDSTETSYTSTSSSYTLADTPTNLAVSSAINNTATLTVDSLPNASSDSSSYYFYRSGDEANHNSGWIQTNSWQDSDFTCNTNYTWYVKYRNGDGVETSEISVTSTDYPRPCGIPFIPSVLHSSGIIDDTIVKTGKSSKPDGTLIKMAGSDKIYVVRGGKNLWIPNAKVFEKAGYKWTDIQTVEASVISSAATAELIKSPDSDKVYIIKQGTRIHVANPTVFEAAGYKWTDIATATTGDVSAFVDTNLVKADNSPAIYVLVNGMKRHIRTAKAFDSYAHDWGKIATMTAKEVDAYPDNNLIKDPNSDKVYLLVGQTKRWIFNGTVFEREGYNWNNIIQVSAEDLADYTEGAVIE